MARLQQKKQAAVTTGGAGQPAFPGRRFTAYTALSPGTGLSCPRRLRDVNTIANLASASGGQDHATSPSASATFVRRALRVHRIPAPHIVTIGRNVPLHRGAMRESIVLICPAEQAEVHATDWHDGQFVHGGCAGGACRAGGYTKRVGRAVCGRPFECKGVWEKNLIWCEKRSCVRPI
jgi:hypothetical protein